MCCPIFFVDFFRILWWIESSKEQHLFKIKILSNIINDFTVTLQQFIASLLKKSIYKIHLFFLFWWSGWGMSGSSQKYYKNSTYKLCFLESCCCFSARKLSVSCVVSHILFSVSDLNVWKWQGLQNWDSLSKTPNNTLPSHRLSITGSQDPIKP